MKLLLRVLVAVLLVSPFGFHSAAQAQVSVSTPQRIVIQTFPITEFSLINTSGKCQIWLSCSATISSKPEKQRILFTDIISDHQLEAKLSKYSLMTGACGASSGLSSTQRQAVIGGPGEISLYLDKNSRTLMVYQTNASANGTLSYKTASFKYNLTQPGGLIRTNYFIEQHCTEDQEY
jgi:hypothetical protein